MTLSTDILSVDLHYVIWENAKPGRTVLYLSRVVRSNCTHYDQKNSGVLKECKCFTTQSYKSISGMRNIWTWSQMLLTFRLVKISTSQYCASDKIEKNEMGRACGAYG